MGTLPLSFEQFSPSKKQNELQWQNSQKSNPSTPWLLSTSQRKNGTNSPELSPRPLDSLWPRLLPSLLNSTTNIAVSMLVMKTPSWIQTRFRHGCRENQGKRCRRCPSTLCQNSCWTIHPRIRSFPRNHQGTTCWS